MQNIECHLNTLEKKLKNNIRGKTEKVKYLTDIKYSVVGFLIDLYMLLFLTESMGPFVTIV